MNTHPITNRGNLDSGSWSLRSRARNDELPWLLVFLFYPILSPAPSHAAEQTTIEPSHTLHLHDGALTARVTATPLRAVMAEVSRHSGARVVWLTDSGERHVSTDFTALPLDDGLRRLLDRYNFLLIYGVRGEHSTLSQIWISSAIGTEVPAEPALPPVALVSSTPPPSEEHWDEALGAFAQRDELTKSAAFLEEERKAALVKDRE